MATGGLTGEVTGAPTGRAGFIGMPRSSDDSAILRSSVSLRLRLNMGRTPDRDGSGKIYTVEQAAGCGGAPGNISKTCTVRAVATTGATRLTRGSANKPAITAPPRAVRPANRVRIALAAAASSRLSATTSKYPRLRRYSFGIGKRTRFILKPAHKAAAAMGPALRARGRKKSSVM